jgi:hypothetical protein
MSTKSRVTRIIASAVLILMAGAGAASACSNGMISDGKGGCYYPPFASGDWYAKQKAKNARMARLCRRGMKWACPGPGPVVH